MNPCVDVSVEAPRVTAGPKIRCERLRRDPGGGGVNVARVICRLGGRAFALFPSGGCVGERLVSLLTAEGVPSLSLPIAEETRENFTALDRTTGEQFRFVVAGPRLRSGEWRQLFETISRDPPEILVASGSLPPGAPSDFYGRLARAARASGVKLVLDASGAELPKGLAAGVWLAKPNLEELQTLVGAPLPCLASRRQACNSLVAAGAATMVALSMGPEGALLATSTGAWLARPPELTPASTIGAGDSFLGGLIRGLTSGAHPAEALRLAVAAGSAALLAEGTQLCRQKDVSRLRRQVSVSAI